MRLWRMRSSDSRFYVEFGQLGSYCRTIEKSQTFAYQLPIPLRPILIEQRV